MDLIDRMRKDIQDRLDAVLGEADKLRKALLALDPRGGSASSRGGSRSSGSGTSRGTRRSSRSSASRSSGARAARSSGPQRRSRSTQRRSQGNQRRSQARRTPPGATKNRVLEALSDGRARTAGEVAETTGLARGTVSTTLSKLARGQEVVKAERGYRLPTEAAPGAAASAPAGDSGEAATPATDSE